MNKKTDEKILVIAEKPSVALDITRALPDKFVKEKNYYEGEYYVVSYAVGHLLTIAKPGEISEKFKSWSLKNLPIIPEHFPLKPLSKNKTQLDTLAKLVRRKDIVHIVNACDAGREGELIFRYVMEYIEEKRKINKKRSRLWLQSMTKKAIQEAFEHLRSDEEMLALADAARSRSEADWLIGINSSRGLTSYNSQMGGFFLTPCGRVQTPTLAMIVEREKERENFVSTDFWSLLGEFEAGKTSYTGKWFDPNFKKDKNQPFGNPDRIWDEEKARKIAEKCRGKKASVTEATKLSTKRPPLLYDLTSLQREANSRFGYSAKFTLGITQSLYEKHKLITYPRTASQYLPEDYLAQVKETLEVLEKGELGNFAREALEKSYVKPDKRIFNNQKVSDHFAIIPTPSFPKKLPEPEKKVYTMILQRFLAVFFPPARFLNITRISEVEGEMFKTEGKILEYAGWKAIYERGSEGEKELEPLPPKAQPLLSGIDIKKDITRPPARFTESTLLSAMEGAGKMVEEEELREAIKERGLGTPATRSAIIEKLIADKYIVREGKELVPTSKSFYLLNLISTMGIEELKSPELTGDWEYKLGLIEKGELTRKSFMNQIKKMTTKIIQRIKEFDESETRKTANFSPLNGQKWYEFLSRFESEDGKITIRKILGGRRMSAEEVKTLLTEKKLGPLEGFRSKKGHPFTASLIFNEESRKVEFVFNKLTTAEEEVSLENAEVIGNSPIDGSEVYKTLTHYISRSAMNGEKSGIKINRVILGKEITEENMKRMLAGEKTELITGFRSAKTRRLFDAFLELDKNGNIHFSFPPRKKEEPAEPPKKENRQKKKDKINAFSAKHFFLIAGMFLWILPAFWGCQPRMVRPGFESEGKIMGKGQLSSSDLARFLLRYNPKVEPETARSIARAYVEEASREGVNHDVAFAQMILETGFLKYGNQVWKNQNNFCGLGATDDGAKAAVFPTLEIGVRAHIQHLKAYASREPLREDLVDPRFKYVKRGIAPTVDGLTGRWATDPRYGEKIRKLLAQLYGGR